MYTIHNTQPMPQTRHSLSIYLDNNYKLLVNNDSHQIFPKYSNDRALFHFPSVCQNQFISIGRRRTEGFNTQVNVAHFINKKSYSYTIVRLTYICGLSMEFLKCLIGISCESSINKIIGIRMDMMKLLQHPDGDGVARTLLFFLIIQSMKLAYS